MGISLKFPRKFSLCLLGYRSYLDTILEERNDLYLGTSIGKYFITLVSLRLNLRKQKELGLPEMLELVG